MVYLGLTALIITSVLLHFVCKCKSDFEKFREDMEQLLWLEKYRNKKLL